MVRPLVLGNGQLLVNFDGALNMRDLYFPYVGQLNHIGGHHCSFGVWVDGHFSWCHDAHWERKLAYKPDTLVSEVLLRHQGLHLEIQVNSAVHFTDNIFLKKMIIRNLSQHTREVRVFFTHDFSIDESDVGDTAVYNPELSAVYHYKRNRYLLANGRAGGERIFEYTTGVKRFGGAEGTWRDAEDGKLANNPIAQGSVDSTISFRLSLAAGGEGTLYYWLVVAKNYTEMKKLDAYVVDRTPARLIERVESFWRTWVNKQGTDFGNLPQNVIDQYKRSLLIVRTHTDRQTGAIIAASDSEILHYNRDHYNYMWPRDGALIAMAAIKTGYEEMVKQFFYFCENSLTDRGFLLHKYNPDGSVGSSWHAWVENGRPQLPIQEDETALVICALWEYYEHHRDLNFIQFCYRGFIKPAADFLASYLDSNLGLPLPSYDLWEERRGIFTYTAATVAAALQAAARFAEILGEDEKFYLYLETSQKVRQGILDHLYDEGLGRFIRGFKVRADGSYEKDYTLESSCFALFAFDVLPADDERVVRTMQAIEEGLWVKTSIGGIARYTDDWYLQKSKDLSNVPGNPWIICTLWLAKWYIARAGATEQLEKPGQLLQWTENRALETGVLPEQLHPYTGEPVSVAPLTWSHATFIDVVRDYVKKYRELSEIACNW